MAVAEHVRPVTNGRPALRPAIAPRSAAAATPDADVLIEARITADGSACVSKHAHRAARGSRSCVASFGDAANSDALEREIAAAIASALGADKVAAN